MTTRKVSTKKRKSPSKAKLLRTANRVDGELDRRNNDAKIDDLQKNTEDMAESFSPRIRRSHKRQSKLTESWRTRPSGGQ
jgi:hypothetical protein